ncbi:hypothetical protein KVV02_006638 [Mortierella alpina]|uniref:Protein-S-isoprenylcysteine O-methyltransferase n=1 Tax=Mortierella alpina TaxID=64518 RepID=A0A9P8A0J8_MORAP|nr:hypothetical protein KVV02_006638 [Mortierella alpina]
MNVCKTACLLAAAISVILAARPPQTVRTIDPKKDKVCNESWFQKRRPDKRPFMVTIAYAVLPTAMYIYLMHVAGSGSIYDDPAFMQLRELKTWHLVLTALSVGGSVLRRWSYSTLDQFFTYQLAIRPGHRLVKTGPYTYLRHPSYTGAFFCIGAALSSMLLRGLPEVAIHLLSVAIARVTQTRFHVPTSIAAWVSGGIWAYLMAKGISLMMSRIPVEEDMLKEHFGEEWDTFASKRWRLVPLIY